MPREEFLFAFVALSVLCAAQSARADTLTFVPPDPDIDDLDHHKAYTWRIDNVRPPQVPEPATMALPGTGLAGLYARRRRQRSRATA